jgi:hypothetical protein
MFRLTLGSDNKKINYITTSSFYSQHPNQSLPVTASFANFTTIKYEPIVEQNYLEWPDNGGNRQLANKIRIEETTNTSQQLFRNSKTQRSNSDNFPTDSPRLGVFFSPTNEVNQDIAEQFGGLSLDDYIGDPKDLYNISYDALEDLRRTYFKKYTSRNNSQAYINLLRYYDNSLFSLIKNFVPYRANLQTGLVVESDILHRNKFPVTKPSTEELQYETSLVIPDSYTVGGAVQDAEGDARTTSGYVPEAVITQQHTAPVAELYFVIEGDLYVE